MPGYREPAREAPTTIRYGPFPRRWSSLLAFPVVVAAWVVLAVGAGATTQLSCEDGRCHVESGYLWITTAQTQFGTDEIVGTDRSENGNEVRVRLYRRDRSTIELYLDALGGASDFDAIVEYLADPRGELSVSAYPSIFVWLAFALGAAILVALTSSVFRTPSSLELVVHPHAIDITERWAVRVHRRQLLLDHPTEVRLLQQRRRTWFDGDIDGAIVQIVDADGRVRPITSDTYAHVEIHRAAADALRAALGLASPPSDDDDDDGDDVRGEPRSR